MNTTSNPNRNNQDEQQIDIRAWIMKFISYWYLFVIFVIVSVAIGCFVNFKTTPIYESSTSVLIKDKNNGFDPTTLMTNMRSYGGATISNEIGIIKSYMLTDRVVKKLGLEVTYSTKGRFREREVYQKNLPFEVEIDFGTAQAVNLTYFLTIESDSQYTVKAKGDFLSKYNYLTEKRSENSPAEIRIEGTYKFGEWVENDYNRFRVLLTDRFSENSIGNKNTFTMHDYTWMVRKMQNFEVSKLDKESSIVTITMKGENKEKIVDFLNNLSSQYIQRGLDMKNRVSENTILFIDNQLVDIEDSLSRAETNLRNFQSKAVVMDINTEASSTYQYLKQLERNKAEQELQLKYFSSIRAYIMGKMDQLDKLIAPSAMGIQDPLLNRLVQELVNLSSERSTLLLTSTEVNPSVIAIDERIENTKQSLVENINNMIANTEMSVEAVDAQIKDIESQMKSLPTTQRDYLSYQRKFDINNDIYNFLLQKRSEAQIIKASNTPDNEILDIARVTTCKQVEPRKAMNLLVALIIGFAIPAIYVILKSMLNNKIMERADVEKICNNTIVGQIPQSSKQSATIVIDHPKSPISEAFRSIRTNNDFLVQGKDKCTILVTGDAPGLGKTFISINVASIYAMYGKKTVIVGFDLRKPRIFQEFQLSNRMGVVDYLCNKASIDDIVNRSVRLETLDIITSGKIPPNPAELIASDRCTEFFNELKERYDYIIIDTPPLGLVTDAVLLMKQSDINLFVVRQGVTHANAFASVINDLNHRGLKISLVINGIRYDGAYGYRYSYGYGYGYGYGHSYGYGYGTYGEGYYGSGYYGEDGEHHHHKHHRRKGLLALVARKSNKSR